MIVLRNGDINNPNFMEAMNLLDDFTGFKSKQLFDFNKLKARVDKQEKRTKNDFHKLVLKYAVKEPVMEKNKKTGQMEAKRNPKTGNIFTRPKMQRSPNGGIAYDFNDRDGFNDGFKELMDISFEIKCSKFKVEDLLPAGLKPKHLRACARIIEDVDPDWFFDEEEEEVDLIEEDPSMTESQLTTPKIVT